jgi:N-acetyl-anhydromuramyl-L-alanine amidase AmpD
MKKRWVICSGLWLALFNNTAIVRAQTHHESLASPAQPTIAYLSTTRNQRPVIQKTLPFFQHPTQYTSRWQAIRLYFASRFGIEDAQVYELKPQMIVLHSTESESENSVYHTFAHGSIQQYLGGVWTHFAIDAQGKIVQYSPLNRISKGQAGVNDLAVGIELIGTASTYQSNKRQRLGSLAKRYENKQTAQLEAAADLVATLQAQFQIPAARIFSHQEIANIKRLSGTNPDYNWLKSAIQDRVYLGQIPDLNAKGQPTRKYGVLEPYGRTDPGLDVMQHVFQLLNHASVPEIQ